MSKFTSDPPLEEIAGCPRTGKKVYRITQDLIYSVGHEKSTFVITVPKGFETDLVTSPRFMWWYIRPSGPYNNSAILHDYLYSMGADRYVADILLRESLKVLKTPFFKRQLMYYSVRLFGWWYYYLDPMHISRIPRIKKVGLWLER